MAIKKLPGDQKRLNHSKYPQSQKSTKSPKVEPALLLHACCADCAVKFIEFWNEISAKKKPAGQIKIYFDNSNIHPRCEYLARLSAIKKIAGDYSIPLIIADWSPKTWFLATGYDSSNRGLRRCRGCWKLRLQNTAKYCKTNSIHLFSTTLLSSHYQNSKVITKIGTSLENKSLRFYTPESSIKDRKTKGFYKQNYCGCIYSLTQRYEEKWSERKQ